MDLNHTHLHSRILILGAGTFGLSTAYHLSQAGYTDITVLDKSSSVPPDDSAGNDLNKIVRAEYEDPFYSNLSLEAVKAWNTDFFRPYFRQVGVIWACSDKATDASSTRLQRSLATIQDHPMVRDQIVQLQTRGDIGRVAPQLDGPMRWVGYLNKMAGYAKAAEVLRALHAACCDAGVQMLGGHRVQELIYNGKRCVGVTTVAGRVFEADLVIVTVGAAVAQLLPQIGPQITAKAWPIAHIQLTSDEARRLQGIPITCAWDIGFLTEPDLETNLMKLCPASAGYTNRDTSGLSLPLEDNDFIPSREQSRLRQLLRDTLPELAERPFVQPKMCWCAETAGMDFVLDFVPGKERLVVATGDSGHAFKMLPIMGLWVKEVIEKGQQDVGRWRWKDTQGGSGEAGWRIGETMDIKDVRHERKSRL